MAYAVNARNAALDGVAALGAYISMHTANPGATGASEVVGGSYARIQTTFGASANGQKTGSQVTLSIPTGTTITHWGMWTASGGGSFICGGALSASAVYVSPGTYNFTPTLTAASGV
jgi:hypothetical protein